LKITAELDQDSVIHDERFRDSRAFSEIVTGEIAHALRERIENAASDERLFKRIELRRGNYDIGCDSALPENLPSAIGELYFRLARWIALVVIIVERNIFVIALDQAATGRVIARHGQKHRRIFAQRKLCLNEALAEARFADNQSS